LVITRFYSNIQINIFKWTKELIWLLICEIGIFLTTIKIQILIYAQRRIEDDKRLENNSSVTVEVLESQIIKTDHR
jgi:hypothetical protein